MILTPVEALKVILENIANTTPDAEMTSNPYYGTCNAVDMDRWNYFVFNRYKTKKSSNNKDFQTFYQLHIIHENYIPEGFIADVIAGIEINSTGVTFRVTADDIDYNYTFKKNTDIVVEIATITVFVPSKRS